MITELRDDMMRGINRLAVRRRTTVERYVLSLLRGEEERMAKVTIDRRRRKRPKMPMLSYGSCFQSLREVALRAGFYIQAPNSPYLNSDELSLLSWLAHAQRNAQVLVTTLDNMALHRELSHCAELLRSLDLRLSPLTLYGMRRGR